MTHAARRRVIAVSAFALLVSLSNCSDDDDTATTSSTSAPSSSAESTAAPSTATPATSSTGATTTSSNLPPPTTSAPSTTVNEAETTKAAVAAAAASARDAYNYAVINYDAPDALDVLTTSYIRDSPAWNQTVGNMDSLRVNGWKARPNPTIADASVVEGEVHLLDGPPSTRAQVTVCTVSAGEIYKPGAAPDGGDVVINDEVVARRELLTMVLEAGAWKIEQGAVLATWNGESECPTV